MSGRVTCRFRGRAFAVLSFAAASLAAHATAKAPDQPQDALLRGQRIAHAAATVTGTAISPLLGVSVLGAFTYAKTPEAERAALPFYCSPFFWIPMGILVTLVLLKDTMGSAIPLLKKPLDALEVLVVNKAALLFAVLPVVWHEASLVAGGSPAVVSPSLISPVAYVAGWFGTETFGGISTALIFAIGTAVGFVVWLAGHAVDVFALLSPIPLLDVLLKGFRVAVYGVIAVVTAISLKAGFVCALLVIGVSLLCFWWAFRLALFGSIFAWDLLRSRIFRRRRDACVGGEVLGFSAYRFGGLRKRSFGALRRSVDGKLEFHHRPVGIGFSNVVRLEDAGNYEVGRGFFFPCLLAPARDGRNYRFLFRLLPRYTGCEEEICRLLHLGGVRDLRIPSEVRAAWGWLSGLVVGERSA